MRQFNLEEYLKNPNQKVVTRDGHKVRILCTDRKHEYPILALVDSNLTQEKRLNAILLMVNLIVIQKMIRICFLHQRRKYTLLKRGSVFW